MPAKELHTQPTTKRGATISLGFHHTSNNPLTRTHLVSGLMEGRVRKPTPTRSPPISTSARRRKPAFRRNPEKVSDLTSMPRTIIAKRPNQARRRTGRFNSRVPLSIARQRGQNQSPPTHQKAETERVNQAEDANSTPLQDGLAIPAEIKRRQDRLAKLHEAEQALGFRRFFLRATVSDIEVTSGSKLR